VRPVGIGGDPASCASEIVRLDQYAPVSMGGIIAPARTESELASAKVAGKGQCLSCGGLRHRRPALVQARSRGYRVACRQRHDLIDPADGLLLPHVARRINPNGSAPLDETSVACKLDQTNQR
jgi:hypothetical protein